MAAIATLVALGATIVNYYLLRSQVDPQVVVYATSDPDRPTIINLVIENIGKGVARNVSFSLSHPIPTKAFGINDPPVSATMKSGPLFSGIPALGPGSSRVTTWGQYGGLHKGLGDEVVTVSVAYRGERVGFFDPVWYEADYPLEVYSFDGTDASDRNWSKKSAKQLEGIAKTLNQSASGFRPLRIQMVPYSKARNHSGEPQA